MLELSQPHLPSFLKRFSNFYDGVIRHINISFTRDKVNENLPGLPLSIEIIISVQDTETNEDESWVNLNLHIYQVREFKLIENNTTSVILSAGLSIKFIDNIIYFAFDKEADELNEIIDTNFFIIAHQCFWTTLKYSDV